MVEHNSEDNEDSVSAISLEVGIVFVHISRGGRTSPRTQ